MIAKELKLPEGIKISLLLQVFPDSEHPTLVVGVDRQDAPASFAIEFSKLEKETQDLILSLFDGIP